MGLGPRHHNNIPVITKNGGSWIVLTGLLPPYSARQRTWWRTVAMPG
jgi:hypothetical protein